MMSRYNDYIIDDFIDAAKEMLTKYDTISIEKVLEYATNHFKYTEEDYLYYSIDEENLNAILYAHNQLYLETGINLDKQYEFNDLMKYMFGLFISTSMLNKSSLWELEIYLELLRGNKEYLTNLMDDILLATLKAA